MFPVFRRVLAFFRRDRLDDHVAEEIQLHLELRTRALVAAGMAPADAEREARRQFGNVLAIRERTRDQWGGAWLDALRHDLRYGVRLIRKAPGFSVVAIASLAVGIGASTCLFSFANALLFRPVHAARASELVQVFTSDFSGSRYGGTSYADYERLQSTAVFNGLLAAMRTKATLSRDDRPDLVRGLLVSANYFDVLGLPPALGRLFRAGDNSATSADRVVVLSHDAWQRRFGADPAVAGRVIELSGTPFTIIGVGPPRFVGIGIEDIAEFFVPAVMQPVLSPGADRLRDRRQRTFVVFGRLAPRVSLVQATAAVQPVAAALLAEDPAAWRDESGGGRVFTVLPELEARFVGAGPDTVLEIFTGVMAGAVVLLLIASLNVATVLLARATTRRKEIAVRLAMGASRTRIIRQLLTEAALLAVAGGALGVLIAHLAAALFLRLRPDEVPAFDMALDNRVLVFSLGASLLTVLLFGLAPAIQTTRPDVNAELKDSSRAIRIRGWRFGLRSGLVVIQVGLSLAFLIGAVLMFRSSHAGRATEPGFRRDGIVSVGIDLSMLPEATGARARVYRDAVRAAAALPGVERVALAALVPMDGSNSQTSITIEDGPSPVSISPDINIVGPGYFALLDIPLLHGREFADADRGAPLVAVVNEMMARRYWNGDAIGKTFVDQNSHETVRVVGIAHDLRHRSFSEEPRPMVYFSADQRARPRFTLHVRTAVAAHVIGPGLERALHDVERTAGLSRAETMDEFFTRMTLPQRVGAGAAVATAVVELSLAVMALYGVIAFAASHRRREIGLRMALGASGRSVLRLIMRDGLTLTLVGVALGIAIAIPGSALLREMLGDVETVDFSSVAGPALLLLLVGAAASYLPARRAVRADPTMALRND